MHTDGPRLAGLAALVVTLSAPAPRDARAAGSKEECVEEHLRGQDLRESGQLARAHQTFLACAQASCPTLVQADCARFSEELDRLVPTVSFAARDAADVEQPDTSVYVDGVLVAGRLEQGKTYELDPGKHVVLFVHGKKDLTLTPTLSPGEKGRALIAIFRDTGAAAPAPTPSARRSVVPLAVAGLGAAALITGGVLVAVGLGQVPGSCSLSTHTCAAPPGDRVFDAAHRGVALANVGAGVGAAGVALLAGGLVWYLVAPSKPRGEVGLSPWLSGSARGLVLSRTF